MPIIEPLLDLIYDPLTIRLNEHDRAFNPFRVLGVERYEIRHVNTLAWLLNPSESHGLGESFLKLFLAALCADPRGNSVRKKAAETGFGSLHIQREIETQSPKSLSDAEVSAAMRGELEPASENAQREKRKGRLDLLVQGGKWLIAVEAKIQSLQSKGQLEHYRTAIETRARDDERLFVYLNCDEDDTPDDPEWIHATWQRVVAKPLRDLLRSPSMRTDSGPETAFMRAYLQVLEEQCQLSTGRREQLLTALVERHDAVIGALARGKTADLTPEESTLVRLNSVLVDELSKRWQSESKRRYPALCSMIETFDDPPLRLDDSSSPSTIRFLPDAWSQFPWVVAAGRVGRPYPGVICELFNSPERGVKFKLMICDLGPRFASDPAYLARRRLYELIQQDKAHQAVLFPGVFKGKGQLKAPDDQFHGVKNTAWFNADPNNPGEVRQFMMANFWPSINALTALMHLVPWPPAAS